MPLDLLQDHHVHSTFSDGRNSPEENLLVAMERGLDALACVDHVRRDTDWLPSFVTEIRRLRQLYPIELFVGVEAKMMDQTGALDLPSKLDGVDRVYIADHQLPFGSGLLKPAEARAQLICGELRPDEVFEALIQATCGAMRRHPGAVIAHLFSVLPKLGLVEERVSEAHLARLIDAALETGASVEVDERWSCPGPGVVRAFVAAGVPILASSDSHRRETIGTYDFVAQVAVSLRAKAA